MHDVRFSWQAVPQPALPCHGKSSESHLVELGRFLQECALKILLVHIWTQVHQHLRQQPPTNLSFASMWCVHTRIAQDALHLPLSMTSQALLQGGQELS